MKDDGVIDERAEVRIREVVRFRISFEGELTGCADGLDEAM